MSPERWAQVEALFLEALELPEAERPAFLERSCNGDEALRGEVVSLLSHEPRAGGFLGSPAVEVAARSLAKERPVDRIGGSVGPYQVLSLLGRGGHGEVYLAWEPRLGRHAALKILSPGFVQEAERKRRFEREARIASALNHPNIVAVYESGQEGSLHYIAAEYVEGQTLRERLSEAALSVEQALDVAIQVAEALRAAHAAGIVHRDVNPANVMLRRDGLVKVLDFGLAKWTGASAMAQTAGHDAAPPTTAPGTVIGTVRCMSPEQVRGLSVDGRTDLFSLGVLLYEMLAGRTPFDRPTAAQVMAAILFEPPPPLRQVRPQVTADLERIVARAMEKDRAARCTDADELLRDLRGVRQRHP